MPRRRMSHALHAAALGAAVAAAGAPAALAQVPAAPNTVSATGVGEVRPEPRDRKDNDVIRRAVEQARRAAVPLAVADARRRAIEIGFAGGLVVGGVVAMAEGGTSPFFGPYDQSQGTFGPGRFCGRVNRYRTERAPDGRITRRVRVGSRRTCRVPSRVTATVTVTYAAAPKG